MESLEGEELKKGLKNLISSWDNILEEAGSLQEAEEFLFHLEENDQHFNRYDFVKALKKKLEDTFSSMIDDNLEQHSVSGHIYTHSHDTVTSHVIQHVLESTQYSDLIKKLGRNVQEAVDSLAAHFDSEFKLGSSPGEVVVFDSQKTSQLNDEEDEDSVLLYNQDEVQTLTERLHPARENGVRSDALHRLIHIVSSEIVQSKHWHQLHQHLLHVLADPELSLSNLGLKFVAKAFANPSHQSSQIYKLLLEFVHQQFDDQNFSLASLHNGLDCTKPSVVRLLKAFRLMNELQQEAPNYWLRYPSTYMKEIVKSSLNLLSHQVTASQSGTKLSPLHFISLVDPRAHWFHKWMHANYCRQELLQRLQQFKIIVEVAVKQCLDCATRWKCGAHQVSDRLSQVILDDTDKRPSYSAAELDYSIFIHSLSLLQRLLISDKGRSLFPVKLQSQSQQVTAGDLLKALIQILVDAAPSQTVPAKNGINPWGVAELVTEAFKFMCSTEAACSQLMGTEEVLNTLLAPVLKCLDNTVVQQPQTGDCVLLHVADILSLVASTGPGRRLLLYGQGGSPSSKTRLSAAHIIAEFTKRALSQELSTNPSVAVIGSFLYVCRLLYGTCQGLLVLGPFQLQACIAQARGQVRAQAGPPNLGLETNAATQHMSMRVWQDILLDNLLHFAHTARGVHLLQQAGVLADCVQLLYSLWEKKLPVNKCLKFGYGTMVTQIAATAPGIQALQNTGFIKTLLVELWSVLECGPHDSSCSIPSPWSLDLIDRLSLKHLNAVINMISSFPAMYQLLKAQSLSMKDSYSFREVPESVMDLIDRIILVDSVAKVHSLFNYEQTHAFGLRLLSVLVSCLDTYLLLQSQYHFQDFLLAEQTPHIEQEPHIEQKPHTKQKPHTEQETNTEQKPQAVVSSNRCIIDMLSMERNYILVKTYLIGGPSERRLPPRVLQKNMRPVENQLPTFFSKFPVPKEYQLSPTGKSTVKTDAEINKFLSVSQTERKGKQWLDKCQQHFYRVMASRPDQMTGAVVQQLLAQIVSHQSPLVSELCLPPWNQAAIKNRESKSFTLSPLQQLGIKITIRYGHQLGLLGSSADSSLTALISNLGSCLQPDSASASPQFSGGAYPGFDWFAASIFLLFHGKTEKTWKFLQQFSASKCSSILWMAKSYLSINGRSKSKMGIPSLFSGTCHNVELLLETELPLVTSAFRMSGYTASQICQQWLNQCFWNYLDWLDIVHYLGVCICLGLDYQVYMCVSIFRSLQPDILAHFQSQDLVLFLKEEPIRKFQVGANLPYMRQLELKYRQVVLPDLLAICATETSAVLGKD